MNTSEKLQVRIIPYRDEIKEMLKIINYEWIEKYFEVTDLDRKVFENPQAEILDKDGYIYMAHYGDE